MRECLVPFAVVSAVLCLSACAETVTATPDEISIPVFSVTGNLGDGIDHGPAYAPGQRTPAGREATAHCAQFGKDARLVGEDSRMMRFACVPRP